MATTSKTNSKKKNVKVEKPVQLSIWEILEHPLFEQNLTKEMELLSYVGKNYKQLKAQIDQQYANDTALLEMAKSSQMKELLRDYPKPEDLTVKYVEVISKKSNFSASKREAIQNLFGTIVKRTAIDIINNKDKEQCKSVEKPTEDSKK